MSEKNTSKSRFASKLASLMKHKKAPDGGKWNLSKIHDRMVELGGPVMSISLLSQYAAGDLKDPKLSQLQALCRVFDVPPEYWFDESRPLGVDPAALDQLLSNPDFRQFLMSSDEIDPDVVDSTLRMLASLAEKKRKDRQSDHREQAES